MSNIHHLQITPPSAGDGGAALSPEQKRFNSLIAQIEQARETLRTWHERIPLFQQAHVKRLVPLIEEMRAARLASIWTLDAVLDRPGWTKAEVATLQEVLLDRLGDVLGQDPEPDPALKALFDKHGDVDFDTHQEQSRLELKGIVEAMTGIDLGADAELASGEDFVRRVQEEVAAREAREAEREAEQQAERESAKANAKAARPGAARKKSPAQLRREEEEQKATQSVREIFRKLASALHPDREPDASRRAEKTALMQRVNGAYAAGDLLALLELQLEVEQVDAGHVRGASRHVLKHYNKVLAEQLTELRAETERVQSQFEMDFGLSVRGPLNPVKLDRLIDQGYQELTAMLLDASDEARTLDDRAATRRWLKYIRRQMRESDFDYRF